MHRGQERDGLRRASWGAVLQPEGSEEGAGEGRRAPDVAFGSVPVAQTVQRAELHGVCRALATLAQAATATVRVVSGSTYAVGGAAADFERQSNKDLWKELHAQVTALHARG